jgi:hypothetical protein
MKLRSVSTQETVVVSETSAETERTNTPCACFSSCCPAEGATKDNDGNYCGNVLNYLHAKVWTPVVNLLCDIAGLLGIYPTRYSQERAVTWFLDKFDNHNFIDEIPTEDNIECKNGYAAFLKLPAQAQQAARRAVYDANEADFRARLPESKAADRRGQQARNERASIDKMIDERIKGFPFNHQVMDALRTFAHVQSRY